MAERPGRGASPWRPGWSPRTAWIVGALVGIGLLPLALMAAVRFLAPRHAPPAVVAPFPSGAALNAIDPAAAPPVPPLPPQKPAVASAPPPAATALVAVPRPVDLKRRTIAQAQRDLARLGYPIGTSDGVIGWKTRAAIRAFQAANGLAVDGELTPELAKALRAARRQ
jgi:hypothetical protein